MHDLALDRYSRLDSPIHRRPAWLKLTFALAIILTVVALPVRHALYLTLPALALLTIAAIARIPPMFLLRRLLLLEPFVLGVALLSLLQPEGWRVSSLLAARGTLALLSMVLLANTTPFPDLLKLIRRLRVPALLITTLFLMHRYLFVLADEAHRMRCACASRTFTSRRPTLWHTTASLAAHLSPPRSLTAPSASTAPCAPEVGRDPRKLTKSTRCGNRRPCARSPRLELPLPRRHPRPRLRLLLPRSRRMPRPHRPQRRRQEHPAAAPQRPPTPTLRRPPRRYRHGPARCPAQSPRHPPPSWPAPSRRQRPTLLPHRLRGYRLRPPATRPR